MIYPHPKESFEKAANRGSNASKKYGWKLARYNYTKKRDEALEQERIRMATRPLMPPHKPISPGKPEKAMHRYEVAVEQYKRKMKQRGLDPVGV